MYKLCKTEQSAMRQRALEEGLLTAMQNQRYEDISVSDLCSQMEIPRKSFYRYFDSKEGALHALLDHRMMLLEDCFAPGTAENRDVLNLQAFFSFWLTQKDLLDALERSGISTVLVERAVQQSAQDQFLRTNMGHLSREYQDEAVLFMVCGLMSMVLRWYRGGFRLSPAEMADRAYGILSVPLM